MRILHIIQHHPKGRRSLLKLIHVVQLTLKFTISLATNNMSRICFSSENILWFRYHLKDDITFMKDCVCLEDRSKNLKARNEEIKH